jgi:hypothetical protein
MFISGALEQIRLVIVPYNLCTHCKHTRTFHPVSHRILQKHGMLGKVNPCFRFSFKLIVAWLLCKVDLTIAAIRSTCASALPPGEGAEKRYAVGMLAEYISAEWTAHLVQLLGLQESPASIAPQKRVLSEMQAPVQNDAPTQQAKVRIRALMHDNSVYDQALLLLCILHLTCDYSAVTQEEQLIHSCQHVMLCVFFA